LTGDEEHQAPSPPPDPRDLIEQLLAQTRAEPSQLFGPPTVRKIIQTDPPNGPCQLGKAAVLTDRAAGTVKAVNFRCKGGRCPRCIDYYVEQTLLRAYRHLGLPSKLYRHLFTADELRCTARGKNLKADYASSWFSITQGVPTADGDVVLEVFTPGPAQDGSGDRCGDPLSALYASLLRAPADARTADGKSVQRHSKIPKTVTAADDDDPQVRTGKSRLLPLPSTITTLQAIELCKAAIHRTVALQQVTGRRGASWFRQWVITGLNPDEIDAVRAALAPYEAQATAEREQLKETRQAIRDGRTAYADYPYYHPRSGRSITREEAMAS
jgi:hypothetical protein